MSVQRGHEQLVAQDREAAVHHPTARLQLIREVALVTPYRTPGARVHRKRAIILPGPIQDAVHHQGSRLELAEVRNLKRPLHPKLRSVAGMDLVQSTVTPAVVSSE